MKGIIVILMVVSMTAAGSLAQERPYISIEEAISIAKREAPGVVIKAEDEDGIYEIKIRTESGERIKFKIDPRDGTIIRKGKLLKEPIDGSGKGNK